MLTQQIKTDMISAMKAKDDLRVQTLRGCMTAFMNELVANNRKPQEQLEDDRAIAVIKRLAKQRKDSATQFAAGGRQELADKEISELHILNAYLPQMASVQEIEKVAREIIAQSPTTDQLGAGKIMGAVMRTLGGNADGATVKEVVTNLLQ